jgi:hypothetical protein
MKKMLSVLVLGTLCGLSHADPLADAAKLWEKGNTQEAFAAYSRLAATGNGGAQVALGEMYGYGVGVGEDPAQAGAWLQRAKQSSSPEIRAAAETMALRVQQRSLHKADIAFYTTRFDGGDLKYADFHCEAPLIPSRSSTAPAIRKVDKDIGNWRSCYDKFAARLNSALPAGKAIPAGLADLMSDDEILKAKALMDKRYTEIEKQAMAEADVVMKKSQTWYAATTDYVNLSYDVHFLLNGWGQHFSDESLMQAVDTPDDDAVKAQVRVRGFAPEPIPGQ